MGAKEWEFIAQCAQMIGVRIMEVYQIDGIRNAKRGKKSDDYDK